MQLRFQTGLTGEQYVSAKAWRDARLDRCPLHDRPGSCSFARHGTYRRNTPPGALIARWYCPQSHTTFSLLPDCLAARLPGTLQDLETVVAHVERASSLIQAADQVRDYEVTLPSALRWLRRRVRLVRQVLRSVIGLLPQHLAGCRPQLTACRQRLDTDAVLVALRSLAAPWLPVLPAPLGLRPHRRRPGHPTSVDQHRQGPVCRAPPP